MSHAHTPVASVMTQPEPDYAALASLHGAAPSKDVTSFPTVVFSRKTTSHGPDGELTQARKQQQQQDQAQPPQRDDISATHFVPSPLASLVYQTDRHGKHINNTYHEVPSSVSKMKPTMTHTQSSPTSNIDTRGPASISKLFQNICSRLGLAEQQQIQQHMLLKQQQPQPPPPHVNVYGQQSIEKQNETRQSLEVRKIMAQKFPGDEAKKCLVLDLDETLVHSSFKPIHNPDYIIPVEIEGQVHQVYVLKRPGVDDFMKAMAEHYEIVIYTASLSKYADPLLDQLDIHKVIRFRLFREHCVLYEGSYVKDLSLINRDIAHSVIIDNSPMSYLFHPRNAIGCSSFIDDPRDRELESIGRFLTNIRSVEDVRHHLSLWSRNF